MAGGIEGGTRIRHPHQKRLTMALVAEFDVLTALGGEAELDHIGHRLGESQLL